MTKRRRRGTTEAAIQNSQTESDSVPDDTRTDEAGDSSVDDAVHAELFGLNETPPQSHQGGRWPTGAELTDAENSPGRLLSGAADWVLQLDGAEIEFAGIEGSEETAKGARIQMWDGTELIFEEDVELATEIAATKGKRKRGA
ncbi:MAG: hypothetical protein RIC36_08510 [Rhodospirillales bacterium]